MSYIKNQPATTVAPIVPAIIPSAASRFIMSSSPSVSANAWPVDSFQASKYRAPERVAGNESVRGALAGHPAGKRGLKNQSSRDAQRLDPFAGIPKKDG